MLIRIRHTHGVDEFFCPLDNQTSEENMDRCAKMFTEGKTVQFEGRLYYTAHIISVQFVNTEAEIVELEKAFKDKILEMDKISKEREVSDIPKPQHRRRKVT